MSKCAHRVVITLEIEVDNERLSATAQRVAKIVTEAFKDEAITSLGVAATDCLAPVSEVAAVNNIVPYWHGAWAPAQGATVTAFPKPCPFCNEYNCGKTHVICDDHHKGAK